MYAILNVKWSEIKNCEEYTKTYDRSEINITHIYRAVVDWDTKTIYETWEEAKPRAQNNEDWIKLNIGRVYGPYGTEASVKTALSKIKRQIKERR